MTDPLSHDSLETTERRLMELEQEARNRHGVAFQEWVMADKALDTFRRNYAYRACGNEWRYGKLHCSNLAGPGENLCDRCKENVKRQGEEDRQSWEDQRA